MSFDKNNLPNDTEPSDSFWEVIYTQRAIRYWQDRKVPRDLLEQVIEAGSKAPSGSNLQPWVFVVVDDDDKRLALSQALKEISESIEPLQQTISQGEQSGDRSERLMLKGARNFFSNLAEAPALIIPCLYGLASPTNDPASLLAGSSIYMAVQNIMLSARALGLGTVMTTAQGMIDPQIRSILDVPEDAHPVALIPIGYPAAKFGPTNRKGLDEILSWNGWTV